MSTPDPADPAASPLARLLRAAGRHPELILARLARHEERLRAEGRLAAAIDVLTQRFHLLEHRGRALELLEPLQRAASAAAPEHMPAQAGRVAEALGRIAYQQGNYLDATEHWLRALDLAETAGDGRVAVAARIGLGQVHYGMGAWGSGLRFHRDAAARLQALEGSQRLPPPDDSYLASKVALNLGVGHLESGQLEDAERQFSHGLAAARRGGHREFEAEAHWHLARAALSRGQLQMATADCRLALDLAGRLHHHWLEAAASRTWTAIALARGDEAAAIRSTRFGLALAERIESKSEQREAHLQLARLLEGRGEFEEALKHLWRHVALTDEIGRQSLPRRLGQLPVAEGEGGALTPQGQSPSSR